MQRRGPEQSFSRHGGRRKSAAGTQRGAMPGPAVSAAGILIRAVMVLSLKYCSAYGAGGSPLDRRIRYPSVSSVTEGRTRYERKYRILILPWGKNPHLTPELSPAIFHTAEGYRWQPHNGIIFTKRYLMKDKNQPG